MRPQARPFTVEIKIRKRPTEPATAASFVSRDDWADLIPPDELLERDVHADLLDPASSEARSEAEKLFGLFAGDPKPVLTQGVREVPVATPAELAVPTVRVLPDLLAAAREQERIAVATPNIERQRAAKGSGTTKPRKRTEPPQTAAAVRVIDPPAQPFGMSTGHAEAALALSRRISRPGARLPPGQRWRKRRLPRACWDDLITSVNARSARPMTFDSCFGVSGDHTPLHPIRNDAGHRFASSDIDSQLIRVESSVVDVMPLDVQF